MHRFLPTLMLLHTTVIFEEGNLPVRTAREMKNVYPESSQKSRMSVFRVCWIGSLHFWTPCPQTQEWPGKDEVLGFPHCSYSKSHQRLAEIHFSWLGYEHIYRGWTWAWQSWKMIWLKYFISFCLLHLCLSLLLDNELLSLMGLYAS